MAERFDVPPVLSGDEQRQLQQLYSYLYQMSEKLNTAMTTISIDQFSDADKKELRQVTSGVSAKTEQEINTVKSLIIKTADVVRNEMQEIQATLTNNFVAISDFGQYQEQVSNDIRANGERIEQNITYVSELQTESASFQNYKTETESYIYSGIIGRKTDGTPITGIAIGDGVTVYDVDGHKTLDDNKKVATFTAERLSFFMNGSEVAYFANNKMYIESAEIRNSLRMGAYVWRIQADGSMGLTVEV